MIKCRHYKYGFHCKKTGSLYDTVDRIVRNTPLTAIQLYISNSRSNEMPKCDPEDIHKTYQLLKRHNIYLSVHSKLLHNPAGATDISNKKFNFLLESTRQGLLSELDICAGLGAGVVVHIGSCTDKSKGIETIIETIVHCLTIKTSYASIISKYQKISNEDFIKKRRIILENAAGEGNKIGSTLEEISTIIKGVPIHLQDQLSVCIDTAHAFGAGLYDWGLPDEVEKFYVDFDNIIGLKHLELFHLNDSRRSKDKSKNAFFKSKKDRHENLGLGYIFGRESDMKMDITNINHSNSLKQELITIFDYNHSRSLGLRKFFEMAYIHSISIIGEPPGRTEDEGEGPGGKRDWIYVKYLMKNTLYPLIG